MARSGLSLADGGGGERELETWCSSEGGAVGGGGVVVVAGEGGGRVWSSVLESPGYPAPANKIPFNQAAIYCIKYLSIV